MSLGCLITSGYSGKAIIELLRTVFFMELLSECIIEYIAHATKVFVNGAWVGIVTKPLEVIDLLKKYRRIGLIPIYTSISWVIKEDSIYIYSDSGRLTRPLFYLNSNSNKPCYENEFIYNKLLSNDFTYNELLIGFNKFKTYDSEKKENTFTASDVIRSNNVFFNLGDLYDRPNVISIENALDKLMEKAGIIDYLDTAESETTLIATYSDQITKFTSHCELHPSLLLGIMGNQIVFPENNQLPRDLFSCGQSKQGVSLYNTNYQNRIDKMGVVLNNGQIPLVKSRYLKYIYNEEHTYGVNAIVAIGSYGGYNVEDSILFNEGSINRGMFNTTYFNMYEAREESTKVAGSNIDSRFVNIETKNVINKRPGYDYSQLDDNGLIRENTPLDDKIIVIGKVTTNISNPDTFSDASISPKKGQLGYVDKAFITEGEEGFRIAKIRIREERLPAQGDKFCSRCGQKGTVGLIIPEENMPFNAEGIRPDIIINPHALPSRMTIGQLVETLMGKACAYYGGFGDCTAFVNKGSKHEIYGSLLRNIGYSSTGNELMYSGETGEQLTMEFFTGPCYYMRLKHMVKDKINYRAQGPRTMVTRQTVQGRANDGGLRIGEMERDGIIAHGATSFLKESMLDRGDDYYVAICNTSGTIAIYNETKNIFISPFSDGPLKFSENFENTMNLEVISKYGKSFSIVRVPYSFKLLIQELQVMNIQMRIITEDNIDQLTSMNYAKTIQNLTLAKLSLKEEQDYNKKYDGKMLQAKPKTTRQIIAEDTEPLMIDLDKKGPIISDSKGEGEGEGEDEDDNDGLSQVTIDSIKRAEDEFSRYQDLDDYDGEDEEREPIKIGDVVNNDELGIENLNNEKQEQTQEQTQTQDQTQSIVAPPIEKEPVLENITTTSPAQDEKANVEKSGNMKTIVINNQ
jgi:DNA-directed RNA polymerase beta subunit